MAEALTSIHGRRLGITASGALCSNGVTFTYPAIQAVITVGAKVANVRAISVQLKDANNVNIAFNGEVEVEVLIDQLGSDFAATGGSTGIAAGANGKILTQVAKKLFRAISDATGLLTLTYTDTGTEAAFFALRFPGGHRQIATGSMA